MLYLAVLWVLGVPADRQPAAVDLLGGLLVVGMQLVSLGILAELVTSYNLRPRDTYSIAETVGTSPPPSENRERPAS